MPDPSDGDRRCVRCGEALPPDRSVCPGCGTLQPADGTLVPTRPRTIGPLPVAPPGNDEEARAPVRPAPDRPVRRAAWPPLASDDAGGAGEATGMGAATPPGAPTDDLEHDSSAPRRGPARRRRRVLAALGAVAAVVVIAVGVTVVLRADDGTPSAPSAADDRAGAIRAFCADPRALGSTVAPYDPAEAAVAYVEHPQPASSTDPAEPVVVQVAPTIGDPVLTLDASAPLVNVAVCVGDERTARASGTCRYELTNVDDLGDEVERPLRRATYRATAYELATGDELATGSIATATDTCPGFAFTDGDGVVAPLTASQLVAWVAEELPGAG